VTATVLHLTDVHLPEASADLVCDVDADAAVADVLTAFRRAAPKLDAIVLTGDQTDDATVAAHRRLREALGPTGQIIAVPGNHDLPDAHAAGWPERTTAEVGAWRVVGVDTSIPGQIHGSVDVPRLCARLDALDERFTVLAMHHPPRSPASHDWFRLLGADQLLAEISARLHVRVVLSGHVHVPFCWQHEQCALLGGPSTLTPFAHEGPEDHQVIVGRGAECGARILELYEDGGYEHRLVPRPPASS
jgi:Icc protein